MGLFNIITSGLSGGRESSSSQGEQPRLSAESIPNVIDELEQTYWAVKNVLAANHRHPDTHPHLVANADKLAQPALQGAFANENRVKTNYRNEDTTANNIAPDDAYQKLVAQDELAAARASVAASFSQQSVPQVAFGQGDDSTVEQSRA